MNDYTELAWAAGFFDGEGCTSVLKTARDKYAYVRLSTSQKYPEVLERFQRAVGHGSIYKAKTREIYSLDVYKNERVMDVLNRLWPFLSERKKQQALDAITRVEIHNV